MPFTKIYEEVSASYKEHHKYKNKASHAKKGWGPEEKTALLRFIGSHIRKTQFSPHQEGFWMDSEKELVKIEGVNEQRSLSSLQSEAKRMIKNPDISWPMMEEEEEGEDEGGAVGDSEKERGEEDGGAVGTIVNELKEMLNKVNRDVFQFSDYFGF